MKSLIIFTLAALQVLSIAWVTMMTGCKSSDVNPKPSITSINPATGPANTAVTIIGTNFGTTISNNAVTINNKPATVTAATATQLTVTVPAGAGTGVVAVSVQGETATGPVFTYQKIYTVTTVAGSGAFGHADGSGMSASFIQPTGLTVDGQGNIYVADRGNNSIRKITPAGVVSTFVSTGFNSPTGITMDGFGNLFVTDQGDNLILGITTAGVVSIIAGTGFPGDNDDLTATKSSFNGPTGITTDGSGNLFIADTQNNSVRKIVNGPTVSTLANTGSALPYGLAVDSQGNLFITDGGTNKIIKYGLTATTSTTFAGSGSSGNADGTGTSASFNNPQGIAIDAYGNLYVADNSYLIRMITTSGVVTTIAGSSGSADGIGAAAGFNNISSLAIDGNGNIYVADTGNNKIRKIVGI
jgi:serine/threonine protein kinase, bacterial